MTDGPLRIALATSETLSEWERAGEKGVFTSWKWHSNGYPMVIPHKNSHFWLPYSNKPDLNLINNTFILPKKEASASFLGFLDRFMPLSPQKREANISKI